jgi:hypothetical protein
MIYHVVATILYNTYSALSGEDCEVVVRPCARGDDDCDTNAKCSFMSAGVHNCTCYVGFYSTSDPIAEGPGRTCEDVDECSSTPCNTGININGGLLMRVTDIIKDYVEAWVPGLYTSVMEAPAAYPLLGEADDYASSAVDDASVANLQAALAKAFGKRGDPPAALIQPDMTLEAAAGYIVGTLPAFQAGDAYGGGLLAPCEQGFGTDEYTCPCIPGFSGEHCNDELDECTSFPCNTVTADAVCVDLIDFYTCTCPPGFEDEWCKTDIDECASNACQNGAACIESRETGRITPDHYECGCLPGFVGHDCETEFDECGSVPCANSAPCVESSPSEYSCTCFPGFSGYECHIDVDECASNPCLHGAVCRESNDYCADDMVGLFSAVSELVQRNAADPGALANQLDQFVSYTTCESALTELSATDADGNSPLLQGMGMDVSELDDCNTYIGVGYMILDFCPLFCGECTQAELEDVADALVNIASDMYVCSCRLGWDGENCDRDVNECGSDPCKNGGTCDDRLDSYACACTDGFSGLNCEDDIDECELNPCLNGGACTDLVHSFECVCADGWAPGGVSTLSDLVNDEALICSENIDECLSSPCMNGGTCLDGVFEYLCFCARGWSGENCGDDVDECGSDPCLHAGVCSDSTTDGATIGTEDDYWNTVADIDVTIYAYACTCVGGWEGTNCADDIDECESNPCQNGGLCVDELDTYGCFCAPGFRNPAGTSDQDCSVEVDPCTFDEDDCDKGFVRDQPDQPVTSCAQTGPGEHECTCYPGYSTENSGVVCTEIDECGANLCQNGAACMDLVFDYACTCMDGYTDSDCETEIAECGSDPCKNDAECLDLASAPSLEIEGGIIGPDYYNCRCVAGWDGHNCEIDVNECDSSPCQNGSECAEEIDVYTCACVDGFSGFLCDVDNDECSSQPCKNEAVCQDSSDLFVRYEGRNSTDAAATSILVDTYHCTCQVGFSGSDCEVNIAECDSSPCVNGAECTDGIPEYVCTCMDGYSGGNCATDNDECLSFPCKNGATCTTPGVFMYACDCVAGWIADECDEDFDECGSNPCKNAATCTESSGSLNFDNAAFVVYVPNDAYHCECADGWEGENCEVNSNECLSDPCQNGSECVDLIFNFTCTCVAGFDSYLCDVEVEPCDRSTDDCDPINGQCHHDGPGRHTCTCNPGYDTVDGSVTGTSCYDFDECASNPCMNGADCAHDIDLGHPGTTWYQCTCLPGFMGDQCEQDIDECDSRPCQFGSGCRESTTNCAEDPEQLLVLMGALIDVVPSLTTEQTARAREIALPGSDCGSVLTGLADPANVDVVILLGMTSGSRYNGASMQHCDTAVGEVLVRDVCPMACRTCSCPPADVGPQSCETTNEQRTNYCVAGGDGSCTADWNDDQTRGLDADCQWVGGDSTAPDCVIEEVAPLPDTYVCTCSDGWSGQNCAAEVDECSSNPCNEWDRVEAPSSCTHGVDVYFCSCSPGFSGYNCDVQNDECESQPCQHNGECTDDVFLYSCQCVAGYRGYNCETDIDECAVDAPCLNGAQCYESNLPVRAFQELQLTPVPFNSHYCVCAPGYGGAECAPAGDCPYAGRTDNCEFDINECASDPCSENTATCLDSTSPCAEDATALAEGFVLMVNDFADVNEWRDDIAAMQANDDENDNFGCQGVLDFIESKENFYTNALGLSSAPDCITTLPTGHSVADWCPELCGNCAETEGVLSPVVALDNYRCVCKPGWGDHNCDRWLAPGGSQIIGASSTTIGETVSAVAGEWFVTTVQALASDGSPLNVELDKNADEIFDITANDMTAKHVTYDRGGVYSLNITIERSGPQLLFVWAGDISLSGSPFEVVVEPNVLSMPDIELNGPGASTARHGQRVEYEGNQLIVEALDRYGNQRPDNADFFGFDTAGTDFEIKVDYTTAGVYVVTYWWQEATYEQVLLVCSLEGRAAGDQWGEELQHIAAPNICSHEFVGNHEITDICEDAWAGTDVQASFHSNCVRQLDVYVIPSYFYLHNGPDVFEPSNSYIVGADTIVAGSNYTMKIVARDEFGTPLSVPINLTTPFDVHTSDAIGGFAISWAPAMGNGSYSAVTLFERSGLRKIFAFGMELNGMDQSLILQNAPLMVMVQPAAIDFTHSLCTGTGCDIAKHGGRDSHLFSGNVIRFHALDRFDNPRPMGADNLGLNAFSPTFEANVTALEDGVYRITYWWQIATYEQKVAVCVEDGTSPAVNVHACIDIDETACVEDGGKVRDKIVEIMPDNNMPDDDDLPDGEECAYILNYFEDMQKDVGCLTRLGNGQQIRELCPRVCGFCDINVTTTVDVMALNVYVIPSAFYLHNGPGVFDAASSYVMSARFMVAGDVHPVMIQTTDEFGTPLPAPFDGPVEDTLEIYSNRMTDQAVGYSGNGLYNGTITLTMAGQHTVYVMSHFGAGDQIALSSCAPGGPEFGIPLETAGPFVDFPCTEPLVILVTPGPLSARVSYTDGPGTVMAQEGRQADVEGGNKFYIHARDDYNNPRNKNTLGVDVDYFAMDPLSESTFYAEIEPCVEEIEAVAGRSCGAYPNATYVVSFWWVAQYAQGYEVCPRNTVDDPAGGNQVCQSYNPRDGDDRIVDFNQIFMRPNEGSPLTAPLESSCVCLNDMNDDLACGLRTGLAGTISTFTIEAKNELLFPNYRGGDTYSVAITGPDASLQTATVTYLRINFYEVAYMPVVAGTYHMDLTLDGVTDLNPEPFSNLCEEQLSTIIVDPAPASPMNSTLTIGANFRAGQVYGVDMTIRDTFGNRRALDDGSAKVIFQLATLVCPDTMPDCDVEEEGELAAPVELEYGRNGSPEFLETEGGTIGDYHATVSVFRAGMYEISAYLYDDQARDWIHMVNSPARIEAMPGSISIPDTRLLNFEPVLGVTTLSTYRYQFVDMFGNNVADGSVDSMTVRSSFEARLDLEPSTEAMAQAGASRHMGGGMYETDFSPIKIGAYFMAFDVCAGDCDIVGSQAIGEPRPLQLTPGPATTSGSRQDPIGSAVSGVGLLGATAGVPAPFTVVLRDEFGNLRQATDDVRLEVVALTPGLDGIGLNATMAPGDDSQPRFGSMVWQGELAPPKFGEYDGYFVIDKHGFYQPRLYINGEMFEGIMFPLIVTAGVMGPPVIDNWWEVPTEGSTIYGAAGDMASFTVRLMDNYGNQRLNDDANVRVRLLNVLTQDFEEPQYHSIQYMGTSDASHKGEYQVDLQMNQAQLYYLKVDLSTQDEPDVYIEAAADRYNVPGTGIRFQVRAGEAVGSNCVSNPSRSGQAGIRRAPVPGTGCGNPGDGGYDPTCVGSDGDPGEPYTDQFTIKLYDQFGNLNDYQNDLSWLAILTPTIGNAPPVAASCEWDEPKKWYSCSYTANIAATYRFKVEMVAAVPQYVKLGPEGGSRQVEIPVTITAAEVDPGSCVLSGLGTVRVAPCDHEPGNTCEESGACEVCEFSEVLIQLKDQYGNAISKTESDMAHLRRNLKVSVVERNAIAVGSAPSMYPPIGCTTWTYDGVDSTPVNPLSQLPNSAEMTVVLTSSIADLQIDYRMKYAPADMRGLGNDGLGEYEEGGSKEGQNPSVCGSPVDYQDIPYRLAVQWCECSVPRPEDATEAHDAWDCVGVETCSLFCSEEDKLSGLCPGQIRIGQYVPPAHVPYQTNSQGCEMFPETEAEKVKCALFCGTTNFLTGAANPPCVEGCRPRTCPMVKEKSLDVQMMAGRDKNLYFQNVWRNGEDGCTSTCANRVDFNRQDQYEVSNGQQIGRAEFTAAIFDSVTGLPKEFAPNEKDDWYDDNFDAPEYTEFYVITNSDSRAWGRHRIKLHINAAGRYRVDLLMDSNPFDSFNVTVKPKLPALSTTTVC